METSAKEGNNVDEAFKLLTSDIVFNLNGEQRVDTVAEWIEEEEEPDFKILNERLEIVEKAERSR